MPTLNPVRPSAATRIKYQKRLDAIIDEMQASIDHWIGAAYRANEPALAVYAQDATPASILQKAMTKLAEQWLERFDELAPKLAEWFSKSVLNRSERALMADLRHGGFSVRFRMTPAMKDAFDAVRAENVSLVKSIASEHLTQVEGLVMRSVSTGRDLGTLAKGMRARYGVTKRRAAFIALSQNNMATATLTRARHLEMGIVEAYWLHSAGGKVPRPEHVKFSGKRYSIAKGHDFNNGEGVAWPGTKPGCRCVSVPIIPGFDD